MKVSKDTPEIAVSLLTGGGDRPYVFGLAMELISKEVALDIIGSDDLNFPGFRNKPRVHFLNLRGDQRSNASLISKIIRVFAYYARLLRYAASAKSTIFHILWNNKIQTIDRTVLMLYYKLLGKKVALTVHNVNAARRDSKDTLFNRITLRAQYHLSDHIFVHTEKMKLELAEGYGVRATHISVIPFGINNAVPNTLLTPAEARRRLGIRNGAKVILFFGNIAPYKGLEYLVSAFQQFLRARDDYRLIIAGRPKDCDSYWVPIRDAIQDDIRGGRILLRDHYIPDDETEVYFKAADALALPYKHIYQSGVLFLGYSFGLPVLAADVGPLKDEIIEGNTGFVFRPQDPHDLAKTVERYFESKLFADLNSQRKIIQDYATDGHSWDKVGRLTINEYGNLLRMTSKAGQPNSEESKRL